MIRRKSDLQRMSLSKTKKQPKLINFYDQPDFELSLRYVIKKSEIELCATKTYSPCHEKENPMHTGENLNILCGLRCVSNQGLQYHQTLERLQQSC